MRDLWKTYGVAVIACIVTGIVMLIVCSFRHARVTKWFHAGGGHRYPVVISHNNIIFDCVPRENIDRRPRRREPPNLHKEKLRIQIEYHETRERELKRVAANHERDRRYIEAELFAQWTAAEAVVEKWDKKNAKKEEAQCQETGR